MNMQTGPGWWVTPFRGGPSFQTCTAPNRFHRWIHRWLGGVVWKRVQ